MPATPLFEIALAVYLAAIFMWICWSTLTGIEGARAVRDDDVDGFTEFLGRAARRGQIIYMPAALVALVATPFCIALGPGQINQPSTIAELFLLVFAILLGSSYVGPRTELLHRYVVADGRDAIALEQFSRILWAHYAKLAALYGAFCLAVVRVIA